MNERLENFKHRMKITEDDSGTLHVDPGFVNLWFKDYEIFRMFTWCCAMYCIQREKPGRGIPDTIQEAFAENIPQAIEDSEGSA